MRSQFRVYEEFIHGVDEQSYKDLGFTQEGCDLILEIDNEFKLAENDTVELYGFWQVDYYYVRPLDNLIIYVLRPEEE